MLAKSSTRSRYSIMEIKLLIISVLYVIFSVCKHCGIRQSRVGKSLGSLAQGHARDAELDPNDLDKRHRMRLQS